jgi:hypothetical protein
MVFQARSIAKNEAKMMDFCCSDELAKYTGSVK